MLTSSYDIRIINARIYDPAASIDKSGEILISGGRIVGDIPRGSGELMTIDAGGALVLPGLIDFHAHVGEGVTLSALPADLMFLPSGVTSVVDGGSRGVANISEMLRSVIPSSLMTVRCLLNMAPTGQVASASLCENISPRFFNEKLMRELIEAYPDEIIGLKLRLCRSTMCNYGEFGLEPMQCAVEIAERLNRFLAVHVTDLPCEYAQLMPMFRAGDVFVHPFQGMGKTIITSSGSVEPSVIDAKSRGVIFDLAAARFNQNYQVAQRAMAQGVYPDIYSSDVVRDNMYQKPVFNLPYLISVFSALGASFADIIAGCTAKPAKLMGMADRIGTLTPGADADISIFQVDCGQRIFNDRFGNSVKGDKLLIPFGTIKKGIVTYLSPLLEQTTGKY